MKYRMELYLTITGCLLLTISALAGGQAETPATTRAKEFETRCGWLDNPTPSNIALYDRDGEWTIGVQGGYQVETDGIGRFLHQGNGFKPMGTTVMVAYVCK